MTQQEKTDYAALALRLSLGLMFIAHACLKIFTFTMAGSVSFFESVGLPGFLAYLVTFLELIGGAALILGLFVRVVAAALIPILVGTILFVHGSKGWMFAFEGGGWEYPVFLIVVSLAVILLGKGAYAVPLGQPSMKSVDS